MDIRELQSTELNTLDIRSLADAELDAVSGGLSPLFLVGVWLGMGTQSIPEFMSHLND